MISKHYKALWRELKAFVLFAPRQQTVIFVLMLLQGLTAGVGLLFIIPLLQVVGFETGISAPADASALLTRVFNTLNVDINLPNVLLSYVVIVTTIASVRYQLTLKSTCIQLAYTVYLRDRLYRSLLNSRWEFIAQHKMSDFSHCLSGQVQSVGHAAQLMLSFASQFTLALVMIWLALLLSWQLSLLALFCAAILMTLLLPVQRKVARSGEHQVLNFKAIFQMLTEQLGSLKMLKSYGSEQYYAQQMLNVSRALEDQQQKLTRINAQTQWLYLVGAVVLFSAFFFIAQQILAVPLSTTLLLLVIFSRLLPLISGLQKHYQQLIHKIPAFKDVSQMLEQCESEAETKARTDQAPILNKALSVQALSYRHPNKSSDTLSNVYLDILKNETVAITGHSGAGKSTLADLLAGLTEPTSGQIMVDGTPLSGAYRIAWRRHVAYVTQEVYLFHDTVRANLNWVCSKIPTDDELWQALSLAAADTFVQKLPQGLDTLVGDRGIRLSGGERQRLALARALLAKPQLLILDEATSALDHNNEQNIKAALQQLHGTLTIVIIAHRETTIAHADKRIDLFNNHNSNIPISTRQREVTAKLSTVKHGLMQDI